jgi:hypothetical protein|tara:strand:- start:294 stop:674 length:381 start_codon:yes stop_codon:yes gene_type:complete
MKLSELFKKAGELTPSRDFRSIAELNKDNDQLKADVEAGKIPSIHDASSSIEGYAWGDLKDLGWAHKEQEPIGNGLVQERWVYTGPNPIKLLSKFVKISNGDRQSGVNEIMMKKDDATSWVEVDYS